MMFLSSVFIFGCAASLLLCGISLGAEWGLFSGCVLALLIEVVSLTVAWAVGCSGFSGCGFQALDHRSNSRGTWA